MNFAWSKHVPPHVTENSVLGAPCAGMGSINRFTGCSPKSLDMLRHNQTLPLGFVLTGWDALGAVQGSLGLTTNTQTTK